MSSSSSSLQAVCLELCAPELLTSPGKKEGADCLLLTQVPRVAPEQPDDSPERGALQRTQVFVLGFAATFGAFLVLAVDGLCRFPTLPSLPEPL